MAFPDSDPLPDSFDGDQPGLANDLLVDSEPQPDSDPPPLSPSLRSPTPEAASFGLTSLSADQPPPCPPALAPLPSPGQFFQSLRQCWPLALVVGLLGAGLAAGLVQFLLPQTQTAWVWLQVDRLASADRKDEGGNTKDEKDQDAVKLPPSSSIPHSFVPAGPPLIKSPLLLGHILEQPEVLDLPEVKAQVDPQAWLERILQLDASNQAVFRLSCTTEKADTAPRLIDAAVQVYLRELREQRQAYLAQLQEQHRLCKAQLPKELPVSASPEHSRLAQVEKALEQSRFELQKLLAQQTVLQGQAATGIQVTIPESAVDEQVEKDGLTLGWLKELYAPGGIEEMIQQIERTSAKGTADPLRKRYVARREVLESNLKQRRQDIAQLLEKQARDRAREEHEGRLTRLQEGIAQARELERGLQEEVKTLRTSQPQQAQEGPGRDALAARQEALRRLGAEILLLELEGDEAPGVKRLGDMGTATPGQERRWWLTGMAGAGVFGFLVVTVAWLEFEGRRVRGTGAVTEGLGLPVLGTLPAVPLPTTLAPTAAPSMRDLTSQNQLAEAADVARTLLLQKVGDRPAVILVTSAHGGEGTTSTACQLALSLGRAWRRTLLVDGHLRKPGVHGLFRLPLDPGLAEVLRGEVEAADAIQPTRASRLWLLPAGHWDNHALQALAQERQGFIFGSLKDQYDAVVIDAGPVLPLADALLLGRHADAVVLAVLCDRSRLPAIHEARQRLATLDVPLLGAVVNGSHSS